MEQADRRKKVLLAMSGGVDSSVAAALLLREGYDVVGVFMRLGSPGESLDELIPDAGATCSTPPTPHTPGVRIGHQGCCSINDAADARLVAARLGIPFYVCNFKKDFGRIIDYFVDAYASGQTPNPCVRCNDWLKFGKLHEYARQIDADFVASGHYARIERPNGDNPTLVRGIDPDKDQSYVLFGVGRDHLDRMLLPIGGYRKDEIRALARELDLPVFDKPDSQEICFVPDNNYAAFVESRRPNLGKPGAILDPDGKPIGTHEGQHRFTVGQRRGVGVALGYPIYVVDKDPDANTITVGPRERLASITCIAHEANWLTDTARFSAWQRVMAQYRYNGSAVPACLRLLPDADAQTARGTPSGRSGRFEVSFDEPQWAVAPGQAIVIYDENDRTVLGGGWIAPHPPEE